MIANMVTSAVERTHPIQIMLLCMGHAGKAPVRQAHVMRFRAWHTLCSFQAM